MDGDDTWQIASMTTAKAAMTLLAALGVTGGIVTFVHLNQKWEKERMHAGVERDRDRERDRRQRKVEECGSR